MIVVPLGVADRRPVATMMTRVPDGTGIHAVMPKRHGGGGKPDVKRRTEDGARNHEEDAANTIIPPSTARPQDNFLGPSMPEAGLCFNVWI